MLELNARTRISELQSANPALLEVLKSTGLYREGDNPEVSIGQLCWTFGFNPGILLMMLQSANAPEEPAPIDISVFDGMPLGDIINHIEQSHHVYLREAMPQIEALMARVAAAHGASDERLVKLKDRFHTMAEELELHLRHEEEALFPMVRDLLTKGSITPTRCGSAVGGPITCMENEHNEAADGLKTLRELTDDYAVPSWACATYQAMIDGLVRFDRDLREHMYKENKVLFPRAMDEQEARTRAIA
jgi:regulator of cell morphogenesis and NO signaling